MAAKLPLPRYDIQRHQQNAYQYILKEISMYWHKKIFEQRQFGGHFVLCYGQKPKIQFGNRAYRIQHTQIMLKSAVTNEHTEEV